MIYDVGFVVSTLHSIQGAFRSAPDVRPDLSKLRRDRLPVVVLALLNAGITDVEDIDAYLYDHGSPFDFGDLLSVILQYRTTERAIDGTPNGLWSEAADGSLTPDVSVS